MPDNLEERMKLLRKLLAPYPDFVAEEPKCECGSDKTKLPTHSDWCPKSTKLTLDERRL